MPDQPELHPVVEQDLSAIAAEIARHRERPENQLLSSQELVKNSIRTYAGVQQVSPAAQKAMDEDSILPAYASTASAQNKQEVEHLLSVAFREGIVKATAEAQKSSPYVLDTFHDALTGKLYPELQKRGIVK